MGSVLVLGGESTGGRLLARLLDADPDLDVDHYSMPHGGGADRRWPTDVELHAGEYDAVLVTLRSWLPMVASKRENHRPDATVEEIAAEIREAYERIIVWCQQRPVPWRFVLYDALVATPAETLTGICEFLDRPPLPLAEMVENGNTKWLAA